MKLERKNTKLVVASGPKEKKKKSIGEEIWSVGIAEKK